MPRKKKRKNLDEELLWEIPEKPNLMYTIRCSEVDVEVNTAIVSKEDEKRIKSIVEHMKDHIYIDRTYVHYKGSRWKSGFILEDRWYGLNRLVLETDFGNNSGQKINEFLLGNMEALAEMYLYMVVELYGYDSDLFEISFGEECTISADYEVDFRENFDF